MSRSNHPASVVGLAVCLGATAMAWALDRQRRARKTALIHRTMVELLLNTLCAGDASTARHSRRVADLTDVVGRSFRMGAEGRARLRVAALLHDLGKLDDRLSPIVHSDHPLSEGERDQVEEHPNQGANILEPLETIHPGIGQIVESHHEQWDGEGYPKGLAGSAIPLESRIISVADVFDALTEPRSYREPWTAEAALKEIRKDAGSKFDPAVVERLGRPEVWEVWRAIAGEGRKDEERLQRGAADGGNGSATPEK